MHTDYHGSVVRCGDATYGYDAFGNEKNGATDANPFRYCGEYTDSESGLVYLRARYYDSSIGAFTSEDPAKDGGNWYSYCGSNPVMFTDRTGLAARPYQPELWNDTPDNPNDIQYRTNCYAYALDFIGEVSYGNKKGTPLPIGGFALQPGDLRPNTSTLLQNLWSGAMGINMQRYSLAGSMLDASGNNHVFRAATSDNIAGNNLGENEWTVYLVATSGWEDYHWYRQNADENGNFDGTWSHKPGNTPVTNREFLGMTFNNVVLDSSGQIVSMDDPIYNYGDIITDPTQISRSSTTSYYDPSGNLLYQSTLTYDKVVGAFVVGH